MTQVSQAGLLTLELLQWWSRQVGCRGAGGAGRVGCRGAGVAGEQARHIADGIVSV